MELGKPIGGGGNVVGHTVPLDGFDQGEHGKGTGVSGGHVPSATNQARGYGQDQSGFNSGLGGEHASGGIKTPIADKFMGAGGNDNTVSGAYEGGSTRDALTGESNAHTTGPGVGVLGENLHGSTGAHHSHHSHEHQGLESRGATTGAYDGSINRAADGHSASGPRDAALTGAAGAVPATALGSSVGHHHDNHGSSGVGVGAVGGSGGHVKSHHQSGLTGAAAGLGAGAGVGAGAAGLASHHGQNNQNVGTGAGAGVLAAQQAGSHGTHTDASRTHDKSSHHSEDNERGTPVSNPEDLDSGSRHGLVFNKATGKYVHRHELDEKK